jgi:hypothetical protein
MKRRHFPLVPTMFGHYLDIARTQCSQQAHGEIEWKSATAMVSPFDTVVAQGCLNRHSADRFRRMPEDARG